MRGRSDHDRADAPTGVPKLRENGVTEIEGPAKARFELLMRKYAELDESASKTSEAKSNLEASRDNVRALLKDEVSNMGLGRGSKLSLPGVGTFSFTTERYYRVPAVDREAFALLLVRRSLLQGGMNEDDVNDIVAQLRGTEVALLSIGKSDLNAWCQERVDEAGPDERHPLPSYVAYFEDEFVPRISLAAAKARRREKAARKAEQRTQEQRNDEE